MNNITTLSFDGSESYSDCTQTIDNSEVVFSIGLTYDDHYEVTVRADGGTMRLAYDSVSRAQMWANYIYFEMQLNGVFRTFERHPHAVRVWNEVA